MPRHVIPPQSNPHLEHTRTPLPPAQAEMLALAKKMLRRKVKDDIVEAAYNRYAL